MAVPTDVCTVQFVLATDQGGEIAVNTMHMQRDHKVGNPVNWGDDVNTIAGKILQKTVAHHGDLARVWAACTLQVVKVYHLDEATGRTLDEGIATPAPAETFGAAAAPITATIPVHLYGYDPAGFDPLRKYKRGRMSMGPFPASSVGHDGLLETGNRDQCATAIAAWLNDLNGLEISASPVPDITNDNMRVGVLSRTKGAFYRLQAVRVGSHYGNVAARQNALPVVYSTQAIDQS